MEKINRDFNVPFYIFDEITQYIELNAKGKCKTAKWNNIKKLLNCAKVNNRLSEEQVNYIIKNYCRE